MKRFVKNTIRYAIKTLFTALLGASVVLFAISPALIVIATKNERWAWMARASAKRNTQEKMFGMVVPLARVLKQRRVIMDEYIDRQAAISILNAKSDMALGTPKQCFAAAAAMLEKLPAADVVEVVRCKDCEDSRPLKRERLPESIFRKECVWCRRFNTGKLPDGYCDHGERKEEWPCP